MKQRILILKSDKDDFEKYYNSRMNGKNVVTCPYYSEITKKKWIHYLAVLWMQKLKLPFQHIWYGDWKNNVLDFDTIICFDRIWGYEVLRYIHKRNKKCRLIFWYWNIIDKYNPRIPKDIRQYCEEWSFDEGDCKKFGFNHNTQFYFWPINVKKGGEGVFFVGRDKNRVEQLKQLKEKIELAGQVAEFYIKRDDTSKTKGEYIEKNLSYYECIEKMNECNCIVELNKEKQSGLTARSLEAIFFSKKLITDNPHIRKQKFYREENILIYSSSTTVEEIRNFLTVEYSELPTELINYYSFDEWVRRFC